MEDSAQGDSMARSHRRQGCWGLGNGARTGQGQLPHLTVLSADGSMCPQDQKGVMDTVLLKPFKSWALVHTDPSLRWLRFKFLKRH